MTPPVKPILPSVLEIAGRAVKRRLPSALGLTRRAAKAAEFLTGEEQDLLNVRTARAFNEAISRAPQPSIVASGILAGKEGRGWYKNAWDALHGIMGNDAKQFTDLMAAISPRMPVKENLETSMEVWDKWHAAGRPTDPASINRILANTQASLPNRAKNVLGVLSSPPGTAVLSGPKVRAFEKNLKGFTNPVTLDTWMAKGFGWNPQRFGGTIIKGDTRISSPGYLAGAATIRQASPIAGVKPSEGQEMLWQHTKDVLDPTGMYGEPSPAKLLGRSNPVPPTSGEPDPKALRHLMMRMRDAELQRYLYGLAPIAAASQLPQDK